MSKIWKAAVVFSVLLNFVSFIAIAVMAEAFIDAQWENLNLMHQLSGDQQALRRELNAATARLELRKPRLDEALTLVDTNHE